MVINYGSGKIAESLVNVIRFGKIAMRQVLSESCNSFDVTYSLRNSSYSGKRRGN